MTLNERYKINIATYLSIIIVFAVDNEQVVIFFQYYACFVVYLR